MSLLILCCLATPAMATFIVDQRVSGAWFHAPHEGEGFALEVLPDGRAVVYWFSYDGNGAQRWFVGQGTAVGDEVRFDNLISPAGALFGDAFDSTDIEFEPVGQAVFRFSACDQGEVSFEVDGFSGQWNLNRVARLDGLDCPISGASPRAGLSGSFFPPAHNGEGFVIQMLSQGTALIYWFTYDEGGSPMWLVGVASDDGGGQWSIADLRRPIGAKFGDDFDPADVQSMPWGGLSLSLGCEAGTAEYQALEAQFGSGQLDLSRLTRIHSRPCNSLVTGTPPAPAPQATCRAASRAKLQRSALLNGNQIAVVDYQAYLPAADCEPPKHSLNGRLTISSDAIMVSGVDSNLFGYPRMHQFPAVEFEVIADQSRLIPVQQDVLRPESGASYWNLLVSPGQVWSEPADGRWSRASFPFALVNNYYNETHNGVATFLFNDQAVSGLRFQVGQEVAPWHKGNYWGQVGMTYSPGSVNGSFVHTLRHRHRASQLQQLPVRPLQTLRDQAGNAAFSSWTRTLHSLDISSQGIVLDGVLYIEPVATRAGEFPYPLEMRMSAFSVTKSASAALALLHLAQRYGAEIMDYRIADYVTVTADHDGWDPVTFAHAIGMATGIGEANPDPNNSLFADENDPNNPDFGLWALVGSAEAKLNVGFRYGQLPWGPGEVVRYNTMHTFVLTAALDALVKQREGPDVNLWELIEGEVLLPIGIPELPTMHSIEGDGSRGIPLGGVGLYPNAQDIAKIALLFDREGQWLDQMLLHPELTRQALYRAQPRGLRAARYYQIQSGVWTQSYYNMSFWGVDFSPGEPCAPVIPSMEGFGGNLVLVPPNGVIAFRFADGNAYDPGALALTSNRIRDYCAP